jgi:Flp pilus assembly protein TadD
MTGRDSPKLAETSPPPMAQALEASRLYQSGLAQVRLGNSQQAASFFQKALALKPDLAIAHYSLGLLLQESSRHDDAVQHYQEAIRLKPDYFEAHNNLGNVLLALERYQEAIERYEKALALKPDLAGAHRNLGTALAVLKCYEKAIEHYEKALVLKPDLAGAHKNLAQVLTVLNRYEEAIQQYDRALALQPDEGEIKFAKSFLYLALGRFAEGWEHYEHRLATFVIPGYVQPRWNGDFVRGVLLVWGEQGLGDQILHSGMIPELEGRADTVVLEVEPRLVTLFTRSFPGVQVIALHQELYAGQIDVQEPIGGLGRYLRPSWEAFPRRERGYLTADPVWAAILRERLTRDKRVVVGLSWRSHHPLLAESKSAQLTDFGTLLDWPDARYVDLQYGDTRAERAAIEGELGIKLERLEDIDNTNDIDGLAALITACDVVVTVSNTTAHLAGALGKPTWVFVPYGHARIWYWFKDGALSPWYPCVHVKRQGVLQPWSDLISSAQQEIARFIGSR